MNAVRKLLLKRFLKRHVCFLRSSASAFCSNKFVSSWEQVERVPHPEWWQVDEVAANKLAKLVDLFRWGVLESGFPPYENSVDISLLGTPGVFILNVLGNDVPMHVVRFTDNGQDWLFVPLHHPVDVEEKDVPA